MELATPITVYWDLPDTVCDVEFIQQTCSAIIECHPLMAQIYSPVFPLDDSTAKSLQHLSDASIALFLSVSAVSALQHTAIFNENPLRLRELLLVTDTLTDLTDASDSLVLLSKQLGDSSLLGISFRITARNWRDLPQIVTLCRNSGIKRLILPMQRLFQDEQPFYLSTAEQEELSNALDNIGGTDNLSMTIHDPFIWRAFNPTTPFPQAGCQAANTMIAIAPDGGIYPCPTLPARLGSLANSTLKEIITSTEKRSFRSKLLAAPADCGACEEVAVCRGGCRGRGLVLNGTLDGLDIACK